MTSCHLLVVGASLAGLRAVEGARKAGHDGPITLVGAERHLPYDRPPLSKAVLAAGRMPDVTFRDESHLRDHLGVELVLGAPAQWLDIRGRRIGVDGKEIGFDSVVIATGATARPLPLAEGLRGVHTLRTLDDAVAIRTSLESSRGTVVVGAGFIGSEVASAARRRGVPVTIVEAAPSPLGRALGCEMGARIAELHHAEGTDLRCDVQVTRVDAEAGRVVRLHLSDGSVLATDLVVTGIGADPATEWLADSGLLLDNGICADETLAALDSTGRPVPGVYVAGDVARWRNPLFEQLMRIEHWTNAAEQGAQAARNALNPSTAAPYSTVPYFWSDWYDHRIQFVGIAEADDVTVVSHGDATDRLVALFRRADRIVGALTVNGQNVIMKYRALIAKGSDWAAAIAYAQHAHVLA